MTTAALLTLSLPALLAAEEARPLSAGEFHARFDAFLALHRDREAPPAALVPGGVRLLRSVDAVRGLPDSRRRDLRRALTSKLVRTRDDLIRQGMRWERDLRRRRVARPGDSLAGPAEMRNARRLIDLIQSVVAPDTWDVNGGPSTASYFGLYQILVIRAPQRVHGEVGEALGGLRK